MAAQLVPQATARAAALRAAAIVAEGETTVADAKDKGTPGKMVRITWVRSQIGYSQDQRACIKTLGLNRLHQTVEHPDSPQLRGQINKVKHMLSVED